MLTVLYPLVSLAMIALPLALAVFFMRRFSLSQGWRWWGMGAATFVLAQAGHIPFNWLADRLLKAQIDFSRWPETQALVFSALFLGLSAGLWEELARYAMFRWWARDARSWRGAVGTGLGHGGAEAVLLGVVSLIAFFQLLALRDGDLSLLQQASIPADQLALAEQQIAAYWNAAWYEPLLGLAERLFALCIQVSLAVLVVQVFVRGQGRWLWLAIGYHALVDALAVFFVRRIGLWVEAIVAGLALFSLWIIFRLAASPPPVETGEGTPPPSAGLLAPAEPDASDLEATRYQS